MRVQLRHRFRLRDGIGYVGNMKKVVTAFDLENGSIIWNYRHKNFPYFSSPGVSSDHVFIGGRDKGLHCINRISGKQKWRFSARGRIDSSPVVSKDKVIFGSMDGKLYIISTLTGKELSSYEVGEPISSTPAVVNDRVLVDVRMDWFIVSQLPTRDEKSSIKPDYETKEETKAEIILFPIIHRFPSGMRKMSPVSLVF